MQRASCTLSNGNIFIKLKKINNQNFLLRGSLLGFKFTDVYNEKKILFSYLYNWR